MSATDIDMLMAEIRAETHDLRFNLNADEVVDRLDRNIWVHDLKNTWFGDSNLDGEFNSTDLVEVFQPGEYEVAQDVPKESDLRTLKLGQTALRSRRAFCSPISVDLSPSSYGGAWEKLE